MSLPAASYRPVTDKLAGSQPVFQFETHAQIIIRALPGQSAQDIAQEVARQLDARERRMKAKARSNFSDQGGTIHDDGHRLICVSAAHGSLSATAVSAELAPCDQQPR